VDLENALTGVVQVDSVVGVGSTAQHTLELSMSSLIHAALRPFRDHVFYFAAYDKKHFRDVEYHCIGCFQTIAESDHPNVAHEGYVTIHHVRYTGFPVLLQYAWVCKECFDTYRSEYTWTLSQDKVPELTSDANIHFDSAYQEHLKNLREHSK
jgi:hypothetical protein